MGGRIGPRPGRPLALPDPPLADDVVRLRPPSEGDQESLVAAASDPEIRRFTRVPPGDVATHADAMVAGAPARRSAGHSLELAICGVADPRLRGMIGVVVHPHDALRAEVGYWVAAPWRSRGLATAALRLVSDWALERAGFVRLDLEASRRNPASQAVARRAGYRREGLARAAWPTPDGRHDLVLFARLAGEGVGP